MATTLPAALTKVHWDDSGDDVLQALSEMATNIDLTNAALLALGGAALLDPGDGLTTGAEASGTPDKLKLSLSGSFRLSAGGLLEPSDFFVVEADDDEASHNSPPDFNLRRLKTGIAVGDTIGEFKYRGSNSSGKSANIIYLDLIGKVISAAAGSESASWAIKTILAGARDDRMLFGGGQYSKASGSLVTGGDKGQGTINIHDYWRRGALLPLQTEEVLGPVVPTAAAGGTIAHTLPARPAVCIPEIVCTTAEHGYTIGDPQPVIGMQSSAANDHGVGVALRSSLIEWRVGQAGIRVFNLTNGNAATITAGSWDLQFRCYG